MTATATQPNLQVERQRIAAALEAARRRIARLPAAKQDAQKRNSFRDFAELERQEPALIAQRDQLVVELARLDQQLAAEQARDAREEQEQQLARRGAALVRTYRETESHLAEIARLVEAALTLSEQHDQLYSALRGMPRGSGWQVAAAERERLGHALRILSQWVGTAVRPLRVSTAPGTPLHDVQALLFDQKRRAP